MNLYEEVERRGGKVMKLNLSSCQEVRNVSMLGGVRELDISRCKSITSGFECLGGVHSLDLSYCTQLRDEHITNLGTLCARSKWMSEYHECESYKPYISG